MGRECFLCGKPGLLIFTIGPLDICLCGGCSSPVCKEGGRLLPSPTIRRRIELKLNQDRKPNGKEKEKAKT